LGTDGNHDDQSVSALSVLAAERFSGAVKEGHSFASSRNLALQQQTLVAKIFGLVGAVIGLCGFKKLVDWQSF
jgi:hypothetical protein